MNKLLTELYGRIVIRHSVEGPSKYYRLCIMERVPFSKVQRRLKVHPMAFPSAPRLLDAPRGVDIKATIVQSIFVGIGEV
jgi:UDP-glucose 4-epimerase